MDEEKKELSELEKRYKRLRWAQWILFALSIVVAILPGVVVAFKVASRFKAAKSGWSLAGFAVIVLGIGALFIMRGLLRKFQAQLPWALSATVGTWVLTFLLLSLQNIVEDAFYISLALAIGCSAALIMGSIGDLCKAQADSIQQEYIRRQG